MISPPKKRGFIAVVLACIYLACSFYIGCGKTTKSNNKKTTKDVSAPAPGTGNGKTTSDSSNKQTDDSEGSKNSGKKQPGSAGEDEDDDDSTSGKGKTATKKSVRFKFTSAQMRAICATDVDTLYGLVKRLAKMDEEEIEALASSKAGKLFTEEQLRDLKKVAASQKRSDIERFQSEACKNQKSQPSKGNQDEEQGDEDESDDPKSSKGKKIIDLNE